MPDAPRIHALIPAAGRSVRFGGTTLKQYAYLMGAPVIAHSIEAVRKHPAVCGVTVVLASDDGIFDTLLRPDYPDVRIVAGGDSRAQSVLNGLESIRNGDPQCDWVLVHDAARPCLGRGDLVRLIEQGVATPAGAILAVPVRDTLKRADAEGRIAGTVDRATLWAAQTPQLFPIAELAANLAAALEAGEVPTDEAAAMERAGAKPKLVEGCSTNIKITAAGDLSLAEFILQRQLLED
jgi:2-C-methyl-D-erythritol 4-phosphate cytidylyltransferase